MQEPLFSFVFKFVTSYQTKKFTKFTEAKVNNKPTSYSLQECLPVETKRIT